MTSQPLQSSNMIYETESKCYPPPNLNALRDFSKLCRICGANNLPLIPLFGQEAQKNELVQKINKYLPITVHEQDTYPLGICQTCANAVLNWHELAQCCMKTEKALALKLKASTQPVQCSGHHNNLQTGYGSAAIQGDAHDRLTPSCDVPNIVSFSEQRIKEHDSDESGSGASDDDQPLANIANKNTKIELYQKFYTALVNFRNHLTREHDNQNYSDFSDSSTSDNEETGTQGSLNSFDDLTLSNMRKDKMDEETRLELSQVQTKINGKVYFTCATCGKNLSSTHTYIFHKRIHTGERPCVCHICGKQFRTPNGLQRHLTETHEKQRRYICVMCHKNFANSQNLKQHMRIHTGERPFVCPHCGKRFTQSGSLHVHLKTHSEHYPHHCAECGAKFRLRSGLTRHRFKHTGERPHACVHCGKAFRQKHELNSHVLTHSDSKPHACAVCGTAFRQRRALRHHCKRLHEADPRDATQTAYGHAGHYGALGTSKREEAPETEGDPRGEDRADERPENPEASAERPKRIVIEDGKRYGECGVCGKRVRTAGWRRHARSHAAKRHSCHACGRAFADAANLARHLRALHRRLRPHACPLCPRRFSRSGHLRDHVDAHSGRRDHVCDVCGKASKSGAALRMHRRTHDARARHACALCGTAFKRRGQLQAHVSVHTGQRDHVCACGKAFRLRSQLAAHARRHVAAPS